jgi:AraC family transcriptional regulator
MNASVRFRTDPPGVVEVPSRDHPVVVIHVGPSVYIHCRRGPWSHSGLGVHGDIDIVPTGVPARWEMKERDNVVLLDVENPGVEIRNRFQIRDRKLEILGQAMWKESTSGNPNGRVYLDTLGSSVAEHLLARHSSACASEPAKGGLPRLKRVLAYIEDNLSQDLKLKEIAAIAEVSVSHLKTTFRESVGLPVHRYVIERRVDRAQTLLREGKLPVSRIAAETGFSHQSHLSYHLRRAFPSESARLVQAESRTIAVDDRSTSRS